MRCLRTLAVLGLAVAGLPGCGGDAPAGTDDRPRVVTTVAPITSIVANVVGDRAVISGLVPEGTNSHTFDPPPSAARALAEADVVFANGLQLEDPTLELAEANVADGAEIVELGNATIGPAEYLYDFSFPRSAGKPNPHLWTNPPMAKRYAEVVKVTMAARDPQGAPTYQRNLAAFAAKIDALDTALRAASATVPRRELLTYHDAYAYFAEEYGWTVLGAIQPSTFAEPSARDVAGLIRQVRETGVPAVFGSEVFPSAVLEQIGRETGARYVDVLRDDDLPGRPGDAEHSWLGLVRFDFVTIVEALGGNAAALRALDVGDVVRDEARYPQ
jgi:ABC-type Zn uptake system ZnuABC Zn-binding protein ZnuA